MSALIEEGIEPTMEFEPMSRYVNAVELPKLPNVGGMIPLRLLEGSTNETNAVF